MGGRGAARAGGAPPPGPRYGAVRCGDRPGPGDSRCRPRAPRGRWNTRPLRRRGGAVDGLAGRVARPSRAVSSVARWIAVVVSVLSLDAAWSYNRLMIKGTGTMVGRTLSGWKPNLVFPHIREHFAEPSQPGFVPLRRHLGVARSLDGARASVRRSGPPRRRTPLADPDRVGRRRVNRPRLHGRHRVSRRLVQERLPVGRQHRAGTRDASARVARPVPSLLLVQPRAGRLDVARAQSSAGATARRRREGAHGHDRCHARVRGDETRIRPRTGGFR